ncbi:MAG: DUF3488 and transglutaminase-like domain-containing protein [Microthrixaceae bacterium]
MSTAEIPGAGNGPRRTTEPAAGAGARRPPGWWLPEVTLMGLTVATALSFGRLFSGRDWVIPVVMPALLVHLSEAAGRRLRLSAWVSPVLSMAIAAVAWVNLTLSDTTALGLPTGDTVPRFVELAGESFEGFRQLVAPAPAQPGFVAAASLAMVVVALYSDTAAHRGNVPIQAVTTHVGVFIFGATLARGPGQLFSAIIFTAALGAHLLAVRTVSAARGRWRSGERAAGTWAAARLGAATLVLALLAGTMAHVAVTGNRDPVVDLAELSSDRADRQVLSPLVSVADQLGPQSDNVMFTVGASDAEPAYWRLTALDRFTDGVWSSTSSYQDVEGELPDVAALPARTRVDQTVTIDGLAGIWLPAASDPVTVNSDIAVSFDEPSATLIVAEGDEMPQGMTYAVRSAIPDVNAPVAEAARDDGVATAQEVPGDLDGLVAQEARIITEGVDDDVGRLRALQDNLRTGEYDTSADYRGAGDPTAAFLEARRGFCTQYASAFVLMARTLGYPARIGVGFTPGNYDEADSTWTVTGRQAHAWPEVFLDAYGWVAFEPTPGRGNPVTEPLTGVPFQQDTGDGAPEPAAPATTAPPPTTVAPTPDTSATQGTVPGGSAPEPLPPIEEPTPTPWWLVGGLALLALLTGALFGRIAWVRGSRERRYHPTDQAAVPEGAWAEVSDHLAMRRRSPAPSETATEFARRMEGETGLATLEPLSGLASAGAFGADQLDEAQAHLARALASETCGVVSSEWSRSERLRWAFGIGPRSRSRRPWRRSRRNQGDRS